MSDYLRLVPAYGRKYETLELAKKDWEEGKDFKIVGGPYCSIRDSELMKERGFASVVIALMPHGAVSIPL